LAHFKQQVSDKRLLANPQIVGAAVHDSGERSVGAVAGGSVLELVQKRKEIVGLALVI
jgi:hypothetical protein